MSKLLTIFACLASFTSGVFIGAATYKDALHSCIDLIDGDSVELIDYAGSLEQENSRLRRSVDMLTEYLLECENNLPLGCIRGGSWEDGQ